MVIVERGQLPWKFSVLQISHGIYIKNKKIQYIVSKSNETLSSPATFKQLTSEFILWVSIALIPWGHYEIDVPLCNSLAFFL